MRCPARKLTKRSCHRIGRGGLGSRARGAIAGCGQGALLLVRSVLVPETRNVLINPRHADAAQIQRLAVFPYPLDARLTSRN